MKKKTLLLTLLALAIVTSLTAGTLAVYNKTITLDAGDITIKKFAFSATGGNAEVNQPIKLAPTESQKYVFTVANYEGEKGTASEVPLKYKVAIDFVGAAALMPGLDATQLSLNGGEVKLVPGVKGQYTFEGSTSEAGKAKLDTYVLVMTWKESTNTAETAAGSKEDLVAGGLKVSVTATQIT